MAGPVDLSGLEFLIPNVAAWLNVEPATVLLILAVVGTVCNLTSRIIPDTATGWLGQVRNIARVVGLHVPNRVLPRTTVDELAVDAVVAATQARVPKPVKDYLDLAKKVVREKKDEPPHEG
jgi:hypothetical protein